jgi:hypothetical protein
MKLGEFEVFLIGLDIPMMDLEVDGIGIKIETSG